MRSLQGVLFVCCRKSIWNELMAFLKILEPPTFVIRVLFSVILEISLISERSSWTFLVMKFSMIREIREKFLVLYF